MLTLEEEFVSQEEMLDYARQLQHYIKKPKDCPEDLKKYCKIHRKKIAGDKIQFLNLIASFDIEDTSLYHEDKEEVTVEDENGKKVKTTRDIYVADGATMYIWQFALLGKACYGRTWQEWVDFCQALCEIFVLCYWQRLVIMIHNESHEWAFMHKWFDWDRSSVFGKAERKPMKSTTKQGIEFRCSYALSGAALATVADKMLHHYKIKKLVGDLDYSKKRGSTTNLTHEELQYCLHDVLVMNAYIDEVLEDEKTNMAHLRMTKTSAVRQYLRKMTVYSKYYMKSYQRFISNFTIEVEEYYMLKQAGAGGLTHSCRFNTGKIFFDVDSVDEASAYPAALCSEEFPMEKGFKCNRDFTDKEILELRKKHYFAVFNVKFTNIRATVMSDNIISESKCVKGQDGKKLSVNVRSNNGRVMSADKLTMTICNIDLENFARFYEWDDAEIYDVWLYKTAPLPKPFLYAVLSLYKAKTELKGATGSDKIKYDMAKALLNSVFGDTYMDPVFDVVEFLDDDTWRTSSGNLEEALKRYNESKSRYNHFAWGVATTAFARYNVCSAIKAIDDKCKELGVATDYIYCDTDSNKLRNYERHEKWFKEYNEMIQEKIRKILEARRIDPEMARPICEADGKCYPLGIWDHETKDFTDQKGNVYSGKYLRFKTLGAKRYAYECNDYDKKTATVSVGLHITVAGCNKKKGARFLKDGFEDPMEAFDFGLEIDEQHSGRLTAHFFDEPISGDFVDYEGNIQHYEERSAVCLLPATFSLDLKRSSAYRQLLRLTQGETGYKY